MTVFTERKVVSLAAEKKQVLSMDLETYSDVDLGSCGVYRYVEGDFHILLFAYAFDDEEVQIVDMACGEKIPQRVVDAIFDENIIKAAWNSQFERTCLSQFFGTSLSPDSWQCSMVWSVPVASAETENCCGGSQNRRTEDDAGERLIIFLCTLQATKTNGGRTRNLPEHAPKTGSYSGLLLSGRQDGTGYPP